jgi:DNA (cytosine-5)-methyltransferase 1
MLHVFEAFSGIGSQVAALRNIGVNFVSVGISEIDKHAIRAYEMIHGAVENYGDISKIDPTTLPKIDLFTYSFPCQDLSVGGEGKGLKKGTRSGLLWECEKIIRKVLPKYLLLENVPNLVGSKHIKGFKKWLKILEAMGYNNYWKVLNAKGFGVPQNRNRVYCVSILKEHDTGTFKFPQETSTPPFSFFQDPNPSQDLYHICPSMKKAINNGKCPVIKPDGIAHCHTTKQQRWNNAGFVKDMGGLRYLSPLEEFLIMGFSKLDYDAVHGKFSRSQFDHMTGNSICVPVLEAIFANLLTNEQR